MLTSDFYYDLPKELIAQTPIRDRAQSRLLVYNRTERSVQDRIFSDITDFFRSGDVLVRNTTKVLPARLHAVREDTGGLTEFLLLERVEGDRWKCLSRPFRRVKNGLTYRVNDELYVEVVSDCDVEGGKIVDLHYDGIFEEVLDRAGEMPLPPYITKKLPKEESDYYQTVYAKQLGSAAAPTAGLHFTNALLSEIEKKGIQIVDILLHVGLGTFRPVKSKNVEDHKMHSEFYTVSPEAANKINAARKKGGRIFAVGTTSIRTLESVSDPNGFITSGSGWTDIFITPGYDFKAVDALITNFHLPESTLLMLVAAMTGTEEILKVYQHAVKEKYHFFSFGDAMLIL